MMKMMNHHKLKKKQKNQIGKNEPESSEDKSEYNLINIKSSILIILINILL